MSRQIFTNEEKRCLQELIIKYKINTTATIGAGNPAAKRSAWARLTNDFNSIESNNRRTEAQLRKCFDNMKSRRKAELTAQKRERMRTGGGPYRPSPEPSTSTAQDSMLVDGDALTELTDIELVDTIDSDSVIPTTGSQEESGPSNEYATVFAVLPDQIEESCVVQSEEVLTENPNPLPSEDQPATGRRRSAGRTGSRLSDYEGASSLASGPRNIRAQVIQDEFALREEQYKRTREREEELHKLKVAERQWLVKAAEEVYKKACIEREAAQIALDDLKNKL